MTDDYEQAWQDPGLQQYKEHFLAEALPKMQESALVMPLVAGTVDFKLAVEVGYALLLDKPLVIGAVEGAKVPERLRRAADAVVELDLLDSETSGARIRSAIDDLVAAGVLPAEES